MQHLIYHALSLEGVLECCASQTNNIIFIAIYRPSGADFFEFLRILFLILDIVSAESKIIVIGGDWNVDLLPSTKQKTEKTNLIDICSSYQLYHTIYEPTRVHYTGSSTCVDNLFVDCINNVTSAGCLEYNVSDHSGIYLNLSITKFNRIEKTDVVRNISNNNINGLLNSLKNESWDDVLQMHDPDMSFDAFFSSFIYYFNINCPLIKISNHNSRKKSNWLTPELIDLRNYVSAYHNLSKKYPIFKNAYKEVNIMYRNQLNIAKQNFHNELITNLKK